MGGVKSILGGGKSFPGGVKKNFRRASRAGPILPPPEIFLPTPLPCSREPQYLPTGLTAHFADY